MDFRGPASPVGTLPSPEDLRVAPGERAGEMLLRWQRLPGARTYRIEYTSDTTASATWLSGGLTTKAKASVTGLTSGTNYRFRVAGIAAAGQGAWSEEITKFAS